MHLPGGTILQNGRYRIVRFIKSGGFGCTYEGELAAIGAKVAIKEFFPSDFCNRESDHTVSVGTKSKEEEFIKLKRSFMKEASVLFKMQNTHIVRVTDVFEENGTAYYVMDYIDGPSLADIIKQKGKLNEAEAIGYISQVCEALKYVHSQNRMHMDIKPGNIMVDRNGKAILIDFGASKYYDEQTGEQTSTNVGTYTNGYAPIEQVSRTLKTFNPATDIYALGATLYKLLTGVTPPNSMALVTDAETLQPLPLTISEPTRKAVESAMQLKDKNRPKSIEEFERILNHKVFDKEDVEEEKTVFDTRPHTEEKPQTNKTDNQRNPLKQTDLKETQSTQKQGNSYNSNYYQYSQSRINSNLESKDKLEDGKADNSLIIEPKFDGEGGKSDKSSKTKFLIGVSAVLVIGLLCWLLFANKSEKIIPTLEVNAPSEAKIGEEFTVNYLLKGDEEHAFKVNDADSLLMVSEPNVLVKDSVIIYSYIYKAEKEGVYTIPHATIMYGDSNITSNTTYISIKDPTKGTINGHEWVDLGLPSGLKWATCNVGANSPEEYGDYFAWGETRPKSEYWDANNETFDDDIQRLHSKDYIGNNGNLTLSHDAARQNWGGSWRMPTLNEIKELINNTTMEKITRNGVIGRLVKSNKNGNSIFLPAAGYRVGSSPYSAGEYGRYWSSTPDESYSLSYCLYVNSGSFKSNWNRRDNGFSVRPVSD